MEILKPLRITEFSNYQELRDSQTADRNGVSKPM